MVLSTDCGCQSDPLVPGVCDPVSGQCPCPTNRNGRRCESCDFGYYGNNVAQPCQVSMNHFFIPVLLLFTLMYVCC